MKNQGLAFTISLSVPLDIRQLSSEKPDQGFWFLFFSSIIPLNDFSVMGSPIVGTGTFFRKNYSEDEKPAKNEDI